ncbi:MAG: CehA/McbA family metallohydrolase [Clostridia bacterium]|nr:CehA/McbA family metallohydrolase [Clostridia bacterium]
MKEEREGVWLRGNLHMHTKRSDGRLPFEEAVALYEDAGYDFIAVTDHWVVSENGQTPGGMLLLSGCEYNVGEHVREGVYHIVGVGMEREPALSRSQPGLAPQGIVDAIHEAGGLAILAHPAWSLNSAEAVSRLAGLDGTEIYNTTSGFPMNARPYSGLFVDQLASMGVLLPCMAADDAHHYQADVFGGYLMVHARRRSREAILAAIREGSFYATQGPRVSLTVEDGVARVSCSPASHVVFYSDSIWNAQRVSSGEGITQAACRLLPQETFVRAEVIDAQGRTAYTSPVRVPVKAP